MQLSKNKKKITNFEPMEIGNTKLLYSSIYIRAGAMRFEVVRLQ